MSEKREAQRETSVGNDHTARPAISAVQSLAILIKP